VEHPLTSETSTGSSDEEDIMRSRLTSLVVLAAALTVMSAQVAIAQDNCQPLKALMQGAIILDPNGVLPPILAEHQGEYGWGGTVYGVIGNAGDYLGGWFYGKDAETEPIYTRANGRGKNGIYLFAFGTMSSTPDTFELQLEQAVWTVDAHSNTYYGNYKASGKLMNGTGVFEGATGSFTLHGDFLAASADITAWNPQLIGKFCK